MRKKLSFLLHSAGYLIRTKILGQKTPYLGGLVITERCNLNCLHCRVANTGSEDMTFDEIERTLDTFYEMGIRSIYLEGGEPFLWKGGKKDLADVIDLIRKKGFLYISIYTNGTFPIISGADTVFVSVDGLKETNDSLRGRSFDMILENIASSNHPNIIVNYTTNRRNHREIGKFCEETSSISNIKGIFFFFHTPYYGRDELFLDLGERRSVIEKIIRLKKSYKIFNSRSALKAVFKDNWKRPLDTCYLYAEGKMYRCCRAIGNDEVCSDCGYLAGAELSRVLRLDPGAVFEAFRYLG